MEILKLKTDEINPALKIEFIASLPDMQSAMSELAEAVKLVMLKGQAFKVKFETINQDDWVVKIDG